MDDIDYDSIDQIDIQKLNLGPKSYQDIINALDDIFYDAFEVEGGGFMEKVANEHELLPKKEAIFGYELALDTRVPSNNMVVQASANDIISFTDRLSSEKKLAEYIGDSYVSAISEAEKFAKENNLDFSKIIGVGKDEAIATVICLLENAKFQQLNKDKHNWFFAAFLKLEEYYQYLEEAKHYTKQSLPEEPMGNNGQVARNDSRINQLSIDSKNQENDIQDRETIEADMQEYDIESDDWLDRLYAENPLIGNKLISPERMEELFSNTKKYIDQRLQDPQRNFELSEQMQITLAVITYAKEWKTGDESGFWRYITSQFGYSDDSGKLRGILCDCFLKAMQKNKRWFLTSTTRYQYKSTIVVHALTTERSWMLFYEFLFDFYKNNMKWTYIKDDPIISRMVVALKDKLIANDKANDENLKISSNVYFFQEGIRKLIIYRIKYANKLISRMLERIHDIINHSDSPAKLYVDILGNKWFESKQKSAKEIKFENNAGSRNVAIDYTRIRPQYSLLGEISPVIMLPDVRLKKVDFNRVELKVYTGNIIVENKSLSFYGNELGKTLKGFDLDLRKYVRQGDGSLNIRVVLSCDEEVIYDSRESLYRECLCFSNRKECDIKKIGRGSYSIFAPSTISFEFSDAVKVSDIDVESWWNAYFVTLEQNFLIKADGQILSYDVPDENSVGDIRVIVPASNKAVYFTKNGHNYDVLTKNEEVVIITHEKRNFQKCIVIMNGEKIDISNSGQKQIENGFAYSTPLIFASDNTCELQVVDFDKNLIKSRHLFKLITGFGVQFDKEFYFEETDYDNSFVTIKNNQEEKKYFLERMM